jgi:hypothetical protein
MPETGESPMALPLDRPEEPRDTNELVERRLDEIAAGLERRIDADVVGLIGPLGFGVEQVLRDVLEARRSRRETLAVVLTTQGGIIEVVERMVAVLRHHYPPATGTSPALGYLEQYDRLIEKSLAGQLSTAEVAFLLEKFDPADLWLFEQAQELSIALLEEWLAAYKFKDWAVTETRGLPVTDEMKRRRAGEIAEQLNRASHWHSHSRGISRAILERELNIRIDDLEADPELRRDVRAYHRLLDDHSRNRRHDGVLHSVGGYMPFATDP